MKAFISRGSVSYTTKHTFGNRFQEYGYISGLYLGKSHDLGYLRGRSPPPPKKEKKKKSYCHQYSIKGTISENCYPNATRSVSRSLGTSPPNDKSWDRTLHTRITKKIFISPYYSQLSRKRKRLRGKSRKEAPTDLINVITLRYYLSS